MLETGFDSSWERLSIAQSLLELLLVDIAKRAQGRAQRYEAIHELRRKFVGFSGPDRVPGEDNEPA